MRDKENLKLLRTAYIAVAIIALIAILPIQSFEFYMLVRWAVFIGCVLSLGLFIAEPDYALLGIFSLLGAFDFKPFNINTNTKSWWVIADLVAAGFFGLLAYLANKVIEDIDRDKEIEAKRPKVSQAEIDKRDKVWKERLSEEDRHALEWRKKHDISEERLAELAKEPMRYRDATIFTHAEREQNQKAMTRADNLKIVGVIVFIAAAILIYHLVKH